MRRPKGNQELANLCRLVFHGEVTALVQDVQFGVRDRIVQLVCTRNDLPLIVFAPDNLNRHLAEFGKAVRDLFRLPVVAATNLMLKETGLSDGAGDEVEIGVESGFAQMPLVAHRREKPFPKAQFTNRMRS